MKLTEEIVGRIDGCLKRSGIPPRFRPHLELLIRGRLNAGQSADDAMKQAEEILKLKLESGAVDTAQNRRKKDANLHDVEHKSDGDYVAGVLSLLGRQGGNSRSIGALEWTYNGQIWRFMNAIKRFSTSNAWAPELNGDDIVRAAYGESVDGAAAEVWEELKDLMPTLWEIKNDAHGYETELRPLDGALPIYHNQDKVLSMGEEAWIKHLRENAELEGGGELTDDFLKEMFVSIVDDEPAIPRYRGARIRFKNADAYLDYSKRMTGKYVGDGIRQAITNTVHSAALVKMFGSNYEQGFREVLAGAKELARRDGKSFRGQRRIENAWLAATNKINRLPEDTPYRKAYLMAESLKHVVRPIAMKWSVLTVPQDFANIMLRAQLSGMPLAPVVAAAARVAAGGGERLRKEAAFWGLSLDSMLIQNSYGSRFGDMRDIPAWARRLETTMHQLNGFERFVDITKSGHFYGQMLHMTEHLARGRDNIDERFLSYLRDVHGVSKDEWIKIIDEFETGGKATGEFGGESVEWVAPKKFRSGENRIRFNSIIYRELESAAGNSDYVTTALLTQGTDRATPEGQIIRAFGLLMTHAFSTTRQTINPAFMNAWRGVKNGEIDRAGLFAAAMLTGTSLALARSYLRDYMVNGEAGNFPPDYDELHRAVTLGGSLGLWGEIFAPAWTGGIVGDPLILQKLKEGGDLLADGVSGLADKAFYQTDSWADAEEEAAKYKKWARRVSPLWQAELIVNRAIINQLEN